ncbi:MAG: N-acetyltransferase [Acidobacteria bacterium]|nr:N-acetyltransferase [Acidobacteriota bacterium]
MTTVAEGVYIHPSAEVHPDAVIGAGTRIWHQAHIREGARIGERCVISKDVYIDAGVTIGNRVKIQNGVSVYHGVTIEDDAFVGPHAAFTNDLTPRSFDAEWRVVPTFVRRGASIGANATVVCGITLGPYSMVAAGSTATVDVPPFGLMIGSPARLVSYICRKGHRMRAVEAPDWHGRYRCHECGETLEVTYALVAE